MRMILFWFCLLRLATATGQSVVSLTPGDGMVNLALRSAYLEDKTGRLSIEQIQTPGLQTKFRALDSRIINFGITSSAFWVRTVVRNLTADKLYIEVGNNALSDVRLFERNANGIVSQFHTGNWAPFARRFIKSVSYVFPLSVNKGGEATVYLRVKHSRGTQFRLKAGTLVSLYNAGTSRSLLEGLYYGFMLVMILYNLFLFFSLRDDAYLFYIIYIFFMALLNAAINGFAHRYLWSQYPAFNFYEDSIAAFAGIAGILFAARFLNTRKHAPFFHRVFLGLLAVYVAALVFIVTGQFQTGIVLLEINSLLLVFSFFLAAFQTMRNGYKPAKFFLIAWSFLLLSVIVFIMDNFNLIHSSTFATHAIQIGSAVEALLLSMALANRINVYKEEKRKAEQQAIYSLEENRQLIVAQNMMLEKKVTERTEALKKANDELVLAMQNLRETQAQLVQREKMASLGELTAGIAHEIQNPLNFVNNFSEVSTELVDELQGELESGTTAAATALANDLKENLNKILTHGKRADSIVRGMLEHSRIRSNRREETSISDIIDESLRLSYHAVRAADKSFNAIFETHFDESVGRVEVVAEDIGRVLLNIFNNAFYSLREKKRHAPSGFQPVLSVSTRRETNNVIISIRDNGMGISPNVMGKIYQPFFTTKPAGEGTGLGLSLSYDIVTKEHGGALQVNTKEGEYAEFLIRLPVKMTGTPGSL